MGPTFTETPSPTRRGRADETVWRKFIRLHVDTLTACDFFTKNVITPLGARVAYCLAFIHIGTRKVFLSSPTYHPHEQWVQQQGRNLLMWLEDQQLEAWFLIHDWDSKFSTAFRELFRSAGVRPLRTPKLAPDANAFCEAWIGAYNQDRPRLSRGFKRRLEDHIRGVRKFGPDRHAASRRFRSTLGLRRHMQGLVCYAAEVDPTFGAEMAQAMAKLPWPL